MTGMTNTEALATALQMIVAARTDEDRTSAVETAKILTREMTEAEIDQAVDQSLSLIAADRKRNRDA